MTREDWTTDPNRQFPSLMDFPIQQFPEKPPVILIRGDSQQIFWRGREIHADDEFRAAFMDLVEYLRGTYQMPHRSA